MPDPARFPISSQPIADLGPTRARCDPPDAVVLLVEMAPAPRPACAVASVWLEHHDSLRESAHETANIRVRSDFFGLAGNDPAYAPDRRSLAIRFVVHEDGRDLETGRNFGRHVRSLRRARGMTQEILAARSGLSADTIRRLEHGSFSPSLETLRKLCMGLDLMLSTLFESFELGARIESRELADLLATRTPRELAMATRVLRMLFDEIDGLGAEADAEPEEDP
jgi:transcriptional regulator with XRE-family HTH domain